MIVFDDIEHVIGDKKGIFVAKRNFLNFFGTLNYIKKNYKRIQKDMMIKQLIQFPDLYYTKNNFPLELSQRAFDQLWRICESYELWCKETKQNNLLKLNIID